MFYTNRCGQSVLFLYKTAIICLVVYVESEINGVLLWQGQARFNLPLKGVENFQYLWWQWLEVWEFHFLWPKCCKWNVYGIVDVQCDTALVLDKEVDMHTYSCLHSVPFYRKNKAIKLDYMTFTSHTLTYRPIGMLPFNQLSIDYQAYFH